MQDREEHRLAIALFRYGIIIDAIDDPGPGVSRALAQAADRTWNHPNGYEIRYCLRQLWRWLRDYRLKGIQGLCPATRKDHGCLRAFSPEILERAQCLRREKPARATKTIIDILVRTKKIKPGEMARSTLDHYLEQAGLSRRALLTLGIKTFRKIETTTVFELVVVDFHHGPYVRVGPDGEARRALLCAFIDHFSRYVPEGRYYLHEDFAALRFGFRHLLATHGCMVKLYLDNGPAFQVRRFAAACDALDIMLIHSKPYQSEGRGVVERFNRTVKDQFESEARGRDELLTLDELNASWTAWLAERYHRDVHSETGESPRERFASCAAPRPAPAHDLVDEWLRLRERRCVHKKWSIVEVNNTRYSVNPSLRGRKVNVLFDPFDPAYVIVATLNGQFVERAFPQKPGAIPPELPPTPPAGPPTDYLALLRRDHETRVQSELAALHLRPLAPAAELDIPGLTALLESCRGTALTASERTDACAFWRRLRPIDPEAARLALERAGRRLGSRLHLRVYLDALEQHLVRSRTKGGQKP